MTEPAPGSFSTPTDYQPPPRSWLSRNSDWLVGIFAATVLIALPVSLCFILLESTDGDRPDEITAAWITLVILMFGIFAWYALACLTLYCLVLNPLRRRNNPCSVVSTLILQSPHRLTVRRYPIDDALSAVFFTLVIGWLVWCFGILLLASGAEQAPTTAEIFMLSSAILLCVFLLGYLQWNQWRAADYGIRTDRETRLLYPARRLFSREVRQPIDIRYIRSIHAERWAARVQPDGRPAPNSSARMSITAAVDDPNLDRRVHLLTTQDAELVGHWLAAYLGVPFKKSEIRYGPHRSFRVSKPLPDDIDN